MAIDDPKRLKKIVHGWGAIIYRFLLLGRVSVIAVTGSCGKTTAKDAIHHVLSAKFRGVKTRISLNSFFTILNAIFRSRPWFRFCVVEAGAFEKGALDEMMHYASPDIGVVLTVGLDHFSAFRNVEAVAEEKVKVVQYLSRRGLAVLNADDPLVHAMREKTVARVMTFGLSQQADVRAENVRSVWPDCLSFDVVAGDQRATVQTHFHGKFWVTSLLPAIAIGMRFGMSLPEAVAALATMQPVYQRMFPVSMPDGVTYMLDDWKASYWTLDQSFEFMGEARAARKIIVLGSISDYPGAASVVYRRVVKKALQVSDQIIITGQKTAMAKNVVNVVDPGKVWLIPDLKDVAEFLKDYRKPGTLILLKGGTKLDHLHRLMHDHQKPISCWKPDCRILFHCRPCPELYRVKTD